MKRLLGAAVLLLAFARFSDAQTNSQLWGTITFNWLRSDQLSYELELEPKVLTDAPDGEPGWASLDVTTNVEYALRRWLDLVGELATGYTSQTDDTDSFELSPRVGVRVHLTTRDLPTGPFRRERLPAYRIVVRNLARVEARSLFYTGDTNSELTIRFRNRFELQAPLNRRLVSDDGAYYLLADWEWFIPLDDPEERFANRQRVRAGLGYRRNLNWRFEALYIWNRSRDTINDGFHPSDTIINLRVKRVF
jgi:hypothetical protein